MQALKLLYSDSRCGILLGGSVHQGFSFTCRIRQGCPLSGALFAILFDPFVRMLVVSMPAPRACIRAMADDLAVALADFRATFMQVLCIFMQIGLCVGLLLNHGEGVVVSRT